MAKRKLRVAELFSGIGSQARAVERLGKRRGDFQLCVDLTCEWEIHAIVAYDVLHPKGGRYVPISARVSSMSEREVERKLLTYNLSSDGKTGLERIPAGLHEEGKKRLLTAILRQKNVIDVSSLTGKRLPNNLDILTYSFPCQDLSNVRAFHGMTGGIDPEKHTKSGLLWEVIRILEEKKRSGNPLPKCLLLENVLALESARNLPFFEMLKDRLWELGYASYVFHPYAPDFGVPQTRKRLVMISYYIGNNPSEKEESDRFMAEHNLDDPSYVLSFGFPSRSLKDVLRLDYSNPIYLSEALASQMNDTPSRRRIWEQNHKLVREDGSIEQCAGTLTTKQDRNPNSGNVFVRYPGCPLNLPGKACYRNLTPRECILLMGFEEKDYEALMQANFHLRDENPSTGFLARDMIYKLTGNSIVVNVLEAAFSVCLDYLFWRYPAVGRDS